MMFEVPGLELMIPGFSQHLMLLTDSNPVPAEAIDIMQDQVVFRALEIVAAPAMDEESALEITAELRENFRSHYFGYWECCLLTGAGWLSAEYWTELLDLGFRRGEVLIDRDFIFGAELEIQP